MKQQIVKLSISATTRDGLRIIAKKQRRSMSRVVQNWVSNFFEQEARRNEEAEKRTAEDQRLSDMQATG